MITLERNELKKTTLLNAPYLMTSIKVAAAKKNKTENVLILLFA